MSIHSINLHPYRTWRKNISRAPSPENSKRHLNGGTAKATAKQWRNINGNRTSALRPKSHDINMQEDNFPLSGVKREINHLLPVNENKNDCLCKLVLFDNFGNKLFEIVFLMKQQRHIFIFNS